MLASITTLCSDKKAQMIYMWKNDILQKLRDCFLNITRKLNFLLTLY